MKKSMLLVTHGFPFGDSERGFLSTEFIELVNNYYIYVLACGTDNEIKYPITNASNLEIKHYEPGKKSILRIILQLFKKDVRKNIRLAKKNCGVALFLLRIKRILSYSFRAELFQKEIENIIKKKKIDIIYTYWGTEELLAALRLKEQNRNFKVITRFHGYDLYTERTDINWQPFQQDKADHCDEIFFVSKVGMKYFNKNWGADEKSKVSYLGTPHMPQISISKSSELVLVSCSNLIKLKRVQLIIQAISVLPDSIKIYWHHIGDGTEGDRLHKLAKELFSSRKNIRWKFWGQIPNEQIQHIYLSIRPQLFITTSSSEGGSPVSIQEAFAMGIPAIGTSVGGISELIINNQTGFLIGTNPDIIEIESAIERYYYLSILEKKKMGDMAYQLWCKYYDAEKNAKNLIQLIIKVFR